MANYDGMFRSSYFKVKDIKAFLDWFNGWCSEAEAWNDQGDGTVGFGGYDHIPQDKWVYEEDEEGNIITDDPIEADFFEELAQHLEEGWAVLIIYIGWEKLRYLTAMSFVVYADGTINSFDAYQMAIDDAKKNAKHWSYSEY